MSMLEIFKKLEPSERQRIALVAALEETDLAEVFKTMDDIMDLVAPLYLKNLQALGADPGDHGAECDPDPSQEGFPWDDEDLDKPPKRRQCSECGIIAPRLLSGGLCDNCSDERNEDHDYGQKG